MLAKRIIPCLDVKDGRVVKGVNFLGLRDAGSPAEVARIYEKEGADELVFLDITASFEDRDIMIDAVRRTASEVFMPLTVGGGIRTLEDIRGLLAAGADKVSINTSAVKDPGFIEKASAAFGNQCIVVAIDAKSAPSTTHGRASANALWRTNKRWEVYINGGRVQTGSDAVKWAKEVESLGAGEILLTSMDRDGTKDGYDIELTLAISEAVSIPVIASGGAGRLEHLYEALIKGKADAVLAASIFHYREFTIQEAKDFLKKKGVAIRL